jgi:RNA polymerase sigma-70 factor (ECF subfamily)
LTPVHTSDPSETENQRFLPESPSPEVAPDRCRLAFWHPFDFNSGVPRDASSLNEIGRSAQNGAAVFATTHWSVVLAAQGESAAAEEALERLCRTYWWPLYGFVRRQGYTAEEAQDLTQGFFAMLLERKDLETVRQEKGRLRSYFLASLKNFLAKDHRRATTIKRGAGRPLVPLDELLARERADLEPADRLSADKLYERRWALILLEQVFKRLEDEHRAAGNLALFEELKEMLTGEPSHSSHEQAAQKLGLTKAAVRQAAYRLRQRCRMLLREEIAHTVATQEEVEDELRHFVATLQT